MKFLSKIIVGWAKLCWNDENLAIIVLAFCHFSLRLGGIFIIIWKLVRCICLLISFFDDKLLGLFWHGSLLSKFSQVLLAGCSWVFLTCKDNCCLDRFRLVWLILFFSFKIIFAILLIALLVEHVFILIERNNFIGCELCILPLKGPFIGLINLSSATTALCSVLLLVHLHHVLACETGWLFSQITLEGRWLLLRLHRSWNSFVIHRIGFLRRLLLLIHTIWNILRVQNLFWNDNPFVRVLVLDNFLGRLRHRTNCCNIFVLAWTPFLSDFEFIWFVKVRSQSLYLCLATLLGAKRFLINLWRRWSMRDRGFLFSQQTLATTFS